jgi:hypothetical protein
MMPGRRRGVNAGRKGSVPSDGEAGPAAAFFYRHDDEENYCAVTTGTI